MNLGDLLFTGSKATAFKNITGVGSIITIFLNISFILAGLILLFYIIIGGIGLIRGAGKDNPEDLEKSKSALTSAVLGFIVVFVSYWIVKLIGQLLGIPNLI